MSKGGNVTLSDQSSQVASRAELVTFIDALATNLRDNPAAWENGDLMSFLEAMRGWVEDMDGYYAKTGEEIEQLPPWRLLADILNAAKSYE